MRLAITGSLNSAVFDSLFQQCAPCVAGKDKELILDLSSAEWAYPSGLVPFGSLINILANKGVTIRVEAYPEKQICSYYCRMGFFKQIGVRSPCSSGSKSSRTAEDRFIEISKLPNARIEDKVGNKLVKLLQHLPNDVEATEVSRSSFIDACGELVSNTRHAYNEEIDADISDNPPALLQAQFYRRRGVVEFCVCDCGVGIKRSMEGEHEDKFKSHLEAIVAALAFRNRGPESDGKGLGLAALHSYIKKNGGSLRIRSGDALKVQRGSKSVASTSGLPPWNGTVVTVEINVDKSADLSIITKRFAK